MFELHLGDCLDILKDIPDNSVDAVITDPPYNIGKAEWDKIDNYIDWCGLWLNETARITKDNGCLYFFHNDMTQIAPLMVYIDVATPYIFRQFIVWNKRFSGYHNQIHAIVHENGLRNFPKIAEYLLYYTFQDETGLTTVMLDMNNFPTLRRYFKEMQENMAITKSEIMQVIGQGVDHCFRWGSTQWDMPTAETYNQLVSVFQIDRWKGFRKYEDLRREYEDLRQEYEELRYTFNNQKTHHSVWNYEIASKNGHITPKPVELMKNIIRHSTNEGDTILDPFMGSGTTGVACAELGRKFIGVEIDDEYYKIAEKRIETAYAQKVMF